VKTKPVQLATDAKLEEFRNHNPEEVTKEQVIVPPKVSGRDARISKTVRMRLRFGEMLRDEAYKRTAQSGEKVSEADLIDEALNEWRKKHKIPAD